MASKRKTNKPTGIRLTEAEKAMARQAARIESRRLGRRIGWTTFVATRGMAAVRRVLQRAEQVKVAV